MSLRLSNESFAAQSVSNWVPNTWSCGSRCPTGPLLALTPWTFGSRMPKRPTQRLLWAKIHTLRYQLQVPRDGGAKSNGNNPELFHEDLRMGTSDEDVSSNMSQLNSIWSKFCCTRGGSPVWSGVSPGLVQLTSLAPQILQVFSVR